MNEINNETALVIRGWMSVHELHWLATKAANYSYIAEIGCAYGRSTRALADNNEYGKVFAIDTWNGSPDELTTNHKDYTLRDGDDTFIKFTNNLWTHIAKGCVIPMRMHSKYAAQIFAERNEKFGLVFIDGWHTQEGVECDINCFLPLIRKGGIIAGHDYDDSNWPGVKAAVDNLIPDRQIAPLTHIWYKEIPYA